MSMKYKNLVQEQVDAVITQMNGLISALESSKISKEDSLVMLKRVQKGLELIENTVSLEEQNYYTNDKKK